MLTSPEFSLKPFRSAEEKAKSTDKLWAQARTEREGIPSRRCDIISRIINVLGGTKHKEGWNQSKCQKSQVKKATVQDLTLENLLESKPQKHTRWNNRDMHVLNFRIAPALTISIIRTLQKRIQYLSTGNERLKLCRELRPDYVVWRVRGIKNFHLCTQTSRILFHASGPNIIRANKTHFKRDPCVHRGKSKTNK